MNETKKLECRDLITRVLITIGIFFALYFIYNQIVGR